MVTMPPFLRITLNNYDVGALSPLSDAPICAIRIKESIDTGMYSCVCARSATVDKETLQHQFDCHYLLPSKVHKETDSQQTSLSYNHSLMQR